jgi:GNAT superfamily N-acetyltransferase
MSQVAKSADAPRESREPAGVEIQQGSFRDLYERETRLLTMADLLALDSEQLPPQVLERLQPRKQHANRAAAARPMKEKVFEGAAGLTALAIGKTATTDVEGDHLQHDVEHNPLSEDPLVKFAARVFRPAVAAAIRMTAFGAAPFIATAEAPRARSQPSRTDTTEAQLAAQARDVLDDVEAISGIDGSELRAGFECRTDEATGEPFVSFLDPDRVGLALSGGGIRSATFNLGLLQGLDHHRVLGLVDYLATVSGGGYIGGWWSAWKHRHAKHGVPPEFPRPASGSPVSAATSDVVSGSYEANEVRHLREFSNFLVPRAGFFQTDLWEGIIAVVSGCSPTMILAASLLAWAVIFWLAGQVLLGCTIFGAVPMSIVTWAGLFGLERRWRKSSSFDTSDPRAASRSALDLIGMAGLAAAIVLIVSAQIPGVAVGFDNPTDSLLAVVFPWDHTAGVQWLVFRPAVAWAGALTILILLRPLWQRLFWKRDEGKAAAFRRISGWLLNAVVLWIVFAAAWETARYLVSRFDAFRVTVGSVGVLAAGAEVFRRLRAWVNANPTRAKTGDLPSILRPLVPQVLAYLVVGSGLVVISALLLSSREGWLAAAGADVIVVIAILWLVDPEQLGLRAFYRSRIVRAYLGASNAAAAGRTGGTAQAIDNRSPVEHSQDDLKLCDLERPEACYRPLHLVCCAANDLAGDQLANLGRGSRSAVVSALGVSLGDFWRSDSVMTFGAALTASAAAFNTQMGSVSRQLGPAVTFLMAAFNLRLGLWTKHPAVAADNSTRRFPGWLFLKEFWSDSQSAMQYRPSSAGPPTQPVDAEVHLSDGAHFENLGLYELVRRHCRYIIVSDCGADTEYAFDDLGNAMRRIREDFGVEIELDVSPLVPDPTGKAAQHMVVGTIHYDPKSDYDQGIILYFKPNFVGNEPDDVEQYRVRNKAFPQETTIDQFYDEAQWEAYRRLGEHAARSALRFLESDSDPALSRYRLFTDAYWQWYPAPADQEERMLVQTKRLSEFTARLRQSGCDSLIAEILPEVDRPPPQPTATVPPGNLPQHEAVVITEMVQVMEDAYVGLHLERTWNLPLNAGWMNMFHRWTRAASFRQWWPIIQPIYSREFSAFLNEQCRLDQFSPVQAPQRARRASNISATDVRGLDIYQWYAERKGASSPNSSSQFYAMRFVRPKFRDLIVGLLEYETAAHGSGTGKIASWVTGSLFIAPSFRGMNLAAAFLPAILKDLGKYHSVVEVVVHLPNNVTGGKIMRTDAASRAYRGDLVRLYKSLGFKLRRRNSEQVLVFTLRSY